MAELCKICGAELPDEAAFCPACGSGREPVVTESVNVPVTEPETVPESQDVQVPEAATENVFVPESAVSQEYQSAPEEGKKKKKVKWWMIVAPVAAVIFAAVLVVTLMWDAIYIRLAPHVVLTEAFTNTVTEMGSRGKGTLWESAGNAVDEDGRYTVQMDIALDYNTYMTGNLCLIGRNDLLNTQTQLELDGNLDMMGYINYDLDMDVYMDGEGLALKWTQATGEDYYGIVYDSFGEDVRSNELLSSNIDEESLTAIEAFLDSYSAQMDEAALYREGIEFSEEYLTIISEFMKAHKGQVGSEMLELNGVEQKCSTITYTVTDAEMNALSMDILGVLEKDEAMKYLYETTMAMQQYENPEEDVSWESYIEDCYAALEEEAESEGVSTFCFYLFNDRVVYADYSYEGEDEVTLSVMFGENPAEDDIVLLFTILTEDNDGEMEIVLSREVEEDSVFEELTVSVTDYDIDFNCGISYAWNKSSGDFTVDFSGVMDGETAEFTLDMKLYEKENGIVLEFPELFGLMASLEPESAGYYEGMSCDITYAIYRGADITKPEFINIRELSEEDVTEMGENINNHYGS